MERKNAVITGATTADLDTVRALFCSYQNWLGISLQFQDFEGELGTSTSSVGPIRNPKRAASQWREPAVRAGGL